MNCAWLYKTHPEGSKVKWAPKTISRTLCSFMSLKASPGKDAGIQTMDAQDI